MEKTKDMILIEKLHQAARRTRPGRPGGPRGGGKGFGPGMMPGMAPFPPGPHPGPHGPFRPAPEPFWRAR